MNPHDPSMKENADRVPWGDSNQAGPTGEFEAMAEQVNRGTRACMPFACVRTFRAPSVPASHSLGPPHLRGHTQHPSHLQLELVHQRSGHFPQLP